MVEPEAKSEFLSPPQVNPAATAAMMKVGDGQSTHSADSLPQPHQLLHPAAHHVGPFHHLAVDPGHHAEMISALEAELQRAHKELTEVKAQLVVAETGKAQALREFTNIKALLDQISLVEHFAASDDVEVETAPLPPDWNDRRLDISSEIDRLRTELEASWNLNSTLAAELDNAQQEINGAHRESSSFELRLETSRLQSELEAGLDHQGSLTVELENAKKDIRTLQATVSDAWSHQGTCKLELARAKEEIAWLEADLAAAQNLTLELSHAKDDIHILNADLDTARSLQESSSNKLLEAQEEISCLRNHQAASVGLASANSALQADLKDLRGLHETSTTDLRQEIAAVRLEYEASGAECANAKEEICRLQGELAAKGREFAIMLRATEEECQALQTKLDEVVGQYYGACTELSEATRQVEMLRAECETVHVKYERCASELFLAKEEIFRLEVEHRASHVDLMTDITSAQEENAKLQAEVASLKDERNELSAELAQDREETHQMEMRHYAACGELYKDIARLQSELTAFEGQHGECSRELDRVKDVFQMELTQLQELHDIVVAELIHANDEVLRQQLDSTLEFERSLDAVRGLKAEISKVQFDLAMQYSALMVDKSLTEKKMEEVGLELLSTSARLQEATTAQKKAETELADGTTQGAVATCTLRADLEAVRAELLTAREAEGKLQMMTLDLEDLRAQMALRKQSTETTGFVSELRASVDALRTELDAAKRSEAQYRESVTSLRIRNEDLERHLYESRDLEAKTNESLILTSSDLQKVSIELAICKEALEWVGGDNAALSAELAAKSSELEAKNAEVVSTKEKEARAKDGEARAKAAFMEYSLKLQRMKLEFEDTSKLADKAKAFELDLDEVTAKLEKVTESERTVSASVASLRAELNNAKADLAAAREDHGIALVEKEQQYDLELNQMRTQWEAAVMAEAEDASFDVGQATREAEKARQEAEELQTHIDTLDAKLETLQLEVEAAKASEEWAFAQMRLKTIPEYDVEIEEEEVGAPVSWEEYQTLKARTEELHDVVSKRSAVGEAEVNVARASEKEMQQRVESVERELRACREELSEAITKREEAEAAKFSCEASLRAKRLERKSLSQSGHLSLNGGPPSSSGKFMNSGDRQGSLNGLCFEDSQSSSSPSRSSFSFASFASPGRSERSPSQSSLAQVLASQSQASQDKPRKLKFSDKIGQYFNKKKILV